MIADEDALQPAPPGASAEYWARQRAMIAIRQQMADRQ